MLTVLADLALRPGDSLREELLLERGHLLLILALYLIVDGVHQPDVELMAILMPLPLEHRRLLLDKFHQFARGHRLVLLAFAHGLQQLLQVEEDALLETKWCGWYSEFSTMEEKTGWWKRTCRMELA